MWPFDANHQEPRFPQLGAPMHQPAPYTPEERIAFLEVKCAQLETAIRELCNAIVIQQQVTNHNFKQMEMAFMNLVKNTLRPPKNMLGGPQDSN